MSDVQDQIPHRDEPAIIVRSRETGTLRPAADSWLDRRMSALQSWACDKPWYLYLPVLLWMGYITIRTIQDTDYRSFIEGLNLGIHEAGHLLFFWGGQDLMAAGGTIAQVAAPLIAIGMFIRQRDYFAITFAICWLGTNLTGIARYMADAREQILPLVSYAPGPGQHDWEYLLTRAGLLEQDTAIANVIRNCGIALLILSTLAGAYLIWEMIISRHLKTE